MLDYIANLLFTFYTETDSLLALLFIIMFYYLAHTLF